jgi:hypothetical protein
VETGEVDMPGHYDARFLFVWVPTFNLCQSRLSPKRVQNRAVFGYFRCSGSAMGSGINELYSLVLRFDSLLPLHTPIALEHFTCRSCLNTSELRTARSVQRPTV